jgi:surfeit locus 1 family protein
VKIPNPLNRKWWFPTLFVIAGVYVLIQLGFWQLDRLEQRRTYNQYVASRWDQAPYDLDANPLPAELSELEYRRVQLAGEFDYEHQIALKNQFYGGASGVNLVAPLRLPDGRAILVARGWVPLSQSAADQWPQFNAPADEPIVGMIQESQTLAGAKPPTAPQTEWFRIDIDAIQQQIPYELLPVFVTQLPAPGRAYDTLPAREIPFEITEGNHFGYAMQWFSFALIFGVGYIQYMLYTERRARRPTVAAEESAPPAAPEEAHA